jgi:hypothetical protein
MTYRPGLVIQGDGSTYQWLNCGPASSAMHLDRDTRGAETSTGAHVRNLTGDKSGGTNLAQDDAALLKGWPPIDHMDVRPKLPWSEAMAHLDRGQGFSLSLSYAPFSGTEWDGAPGFRKNHRVFVNERSAGELLVYDPLADGRRVGIPQGPDWIPEDLVRRAAGLLDLDGQGNLLGQGYAQLGFTRDTEPDYKVVVTAGYFWRYILDSRGRIIRHDRARTGGFSARCTAPRLHDWATAALRAAYAPRSLVRLTSGSRTGWYLQPGGSHVSLRRI